MSAIETTDRIGLGEIQADRERASDYRAWCPVCGESCKVFAQHLQATRRRPCQFLGYSGFCVSCQLGGIEVEGPEARLF